MQALQHQTGEGPLSANKEVEIRSLKSEIDVLKKQIAGRDSFWLSSSHAQSHDPAAKFEYKVWEKQGQTEE